MIDIGTWEDFLTFVDRKGWAWNNLIGQDSENHLFSDRTWISVVSAGIRPGGGDCTSAINTLMASLSSSGFITIFWPPGAYTAVGPINFPRFNVVWQGCGGSAAGTGASKLTLTGTGSSPLITMNDSFGCEIRDMYIETNNAAYTGTIVRIANTGVTDPQKNALRCVSFQDTTHACGFVSLDKSIETTLEDCNFIGGSGAIGGMTAGNYSNVVSILRCQFSGSLNVPIQNMGESWTVDGCTFEALSSGAAGAIITATTARPIGAKITGNWFGDVTAANGTWMTLWGTGHHISGNKIASDGVHNTVGIGLNAVVGAAIVGNEFENITTAISFDTTGCDRITTEPNNFTNVTNKRLNTSNLSGYDLSSSAAYEWIQNGKVREWGVTTVTTGTPLAVTYPKAMSAAPEGIAVALVNPSAGTNTVYGTTPSSSSMTLNVAGTAGTNAVYWEVTGKVT